VKDLVTRLHAHTLQQMQYYAKHKLGIGLKPNCHSVAYPFLGSGQGAADSPARWGFISDALIRSYNKVAHPAIIKSPLSSTTINQKIQAFVDDTRVLLISQGLLPPGLQLLHDIMSSLRHDFQAWENLLHAASGKLELEKCRFGLIRWNYDSQGNGYLCSSTQTPLEITDSETSKVVEVPQLEPHEAYKYLGVQIALDGNMSAQQQAIQTKCQHFIQIFSQSNLSQSNMQLCYRTVFGPSIKYVLPATTLDPDFLDRVQRPLISLILSKLGFNQHMPKEVVLAPLHFGGLGLFDLIIEQGIAQTLYILGQIRSQSSSADTILILLETYQLTSGIIQNPLESTKPCMVYIDSPWVHSVQSFLYQCNAQILIPSLQHHTPLRENDTVLMAQAQALQWYIVPI
jgi:hypothetical protein